MNIIKVISSVVSEVKERRSIREQAKLFAMDNGIKDREKFVREFMEMYQCKNDLGRYVVKFIEPEDEVNENIAVTMLGSMLSSILTITTNDNPEYSFRAVESLGRICLDITLETGTPSEQFELMALMQKYSVLDKGEEDGEE